MNVHVWREKLLPAFQAMCIIGASVVIDGGKESQF